MFRYLLVIGCLSMLADLPSYAADTSAADGNSTSSNAAAKAELKASFATRLQSLSAAKAAGSIGECTNGTVAVVGDITDSGISALVEAENTDRNRLYLILGNETNVSAALIGERNAMRNYQNAKPGEWLRTRDGKWKKK